MARTAGIVFRLDNALLDWGRGWALLPSALFLLLLEVAAFHGGLEGIQGSLHLRWNDEQSCTVCAWVYVWVWTWCWCGVLHLWTKSSAWTVFSIEKFPLSALLDQQGALQMWIRLSYWGWKCQYLEWGIMQRTGWSICQRLVFEFLRLWIGEKWPFDVKAIQSLGVPSKSSYRRKQDAFRVA